MRLFTFTLLLSILTLAQTFSQNKGSDPIKLEVSSDTKPTIELNPGSYDKKKKAEEAKKKKRKKNVFYGIKCKRKTLKRVKNTTVTFEKFYLLPNFEQPNAYPYAKYLYNNDKKEIARVRTAKESTGIPLHGMYERIVNREVRERGYFYKGVKHGRWESYDKNGNLTNKTKWDKGFPKNAEITLYPQDTRLIKEVIPIQYDKKEGMYLSFYENGNVKEVGEYLENEKVGLWIEYYDFIQKNGYQRKKREVMHKKKKDVFANIEPIVQRAWNENGEQTIKKKRNARR